MVKLKLTNSQTNAFSLFRLVIFVTLMFSLGLNLMLYFTMKDYPIEMKILRVKFNEITELLLQNEKQNIDLLALVKQLDSNLKDANTKIAKNAVLFDKLEQNYYSQQHAVDSLAKAKNYLFERVGLLEAELAKITSLLTVECTVPNGTQG
jgi:hypothetical protein